MHYIDTPRDEVILKCYRIGLTLKETASILEKVGHRKISQQRIGKILEEIAVEADTLVREANEKDRRRRLLEMSVKSLSFDVSVL